MASVEDVQKLAALARLTLTEEECAKFAQEFDGILGYVGQIEALTITTPDARATPAVRNVMRDDGEPHASGTYTAAIIAEFPEKTGDALKVKQIITHD